MDFKKIELIFLGVFVAIDIFLFFTLWQTPYLSQNKATNSESGIVTEMVADNITLPSLEMDGEEGYYLAGKVDNDLGENIGKLTDQRSSYDQNTRELTSKLNVTLKKDSREKLIDALNDFKADSKHIIHGKEYAYSKQLSSIHEIVYVQATDFGKIMDEVGQIHFHVRDGAVSSYTQTYQGNITIAREKQETISQTQAVNDLYMYSGLPNDSKVIDVQLGYSKLTQVKGNVILFPSWVISIENKNTKNIQIKKVNAFNGTIITDSIEAPTETK